MPAFFVLELLALGSALGAGVHPYLPVPQPLPAQASPSPEPAASPAPGLLQPSPSPKSEAPKKEQDVIVEMSEAVPWEDPDPPVFPWRYIKRQNKDAIENGKYKWGLLHPDYKLCDEGKKQSPISITDVKVMPAKLSTMPLLIPNFRPAPMHLVNDGHGIKILMPKGAGASYLRLGDDTYNVTEAIIHSPSEHMMAGFPDEMDIQLMCENAEGEKAVLSLQLDGHENEDNPNPFLDRIMGWWPSSPMTQIRKDNVTINLAELFPKEITYWSKHGSVRKAYPYFHYEGSLTRPPCTEGVKHFIWGKPGMVYRKQVQAYRMLLEKMDEIDGNGRNAKVLDGRTVEYRSFY